MEHNKAPGPNGFLTEFYQIFWEVVKGDLMALFHDFHSRNLALFSLNFGIITLLPKCQAAVKIEQYRPICLLNVSFKIFTTVETNRINKIAQKVIRPSQSAFLTGGYILEGAMVLHETIHEMYKKNRVGTKGFSPLGCQWIQYFVSRGSVAVKVNNEIGRYFQTKKGLKQGKLLLYGGRLVLINSVLSSFAMYMMSFFEIPKDILKKLDFYRSSFFWQGDNHRKNID
ncbi:hypothetical protein U9M48_039408 [Paspalum notatum var. saurae]|uniref:Reverse transcriptase n=1 Tax=Paspalum notatum var. saurae TaxID=547442 RepID=A0AAQ3XCP2_PASNO